MTIESPGEKPLLRTALYERHIAAGARMVPFAGWEMPVYYASINREVQAVRNASGLFDVSHMGRLALRGSGAAERLQYLTVNDIGRLKPGSGHYTLMLRDDGGILDDLIVYRRGENEFLLIVNASNREKIVGWMQGHDCSGMLEDITMNSGLIALQGPRAVAQLGPLLEGGLASLPQRFHFAETLVGGIRCEVSRTGYTGEDGVEITLPSDQSSAVWDRLTLAGAEPCGLGARDTLRLEAAYCLYGHEISEEINPVEAGLSWVVKLQKGDFIGRAAVEARQTAPSRRSLVGLVMQERAVPRSGQIVYQSDEMIGVVTSGTFSPTLQKSIALALVSRAVSVGSEIAVAAREKMRMGRACAFPFYKSVG